jgi:hypothetical protein
MKKLLLACSMVYMCSAAFAYTKKDYGNDRNRLYIGLSGGVRTEIGFAGLSVSRPIMPNTYVTAGIGISTFIFKGGINLQQFTKPDRLGFAFGLGIYYAKGGTVIKTTMQSNANITYNLYTNSFVGINPIVGYHFKLADRVRFYTQANYGLALMKPTTFTYSTIFPFTPTSADEKLINATNTLVKSSGFGLSVGFMFAFE